MPARCWSKPRGRLFEGPGNFGIYERVRRRRGTHVAAVAVARKIESWSGICSPATRTTPGFAPRCMPRSCATLSYGLVTPLGVASVVAGYEYNLTKSRREERQRGERAEAAYRRFTEGWTKRGKSAPADASKEARQ